MKLDIAWHWREGMRVMGSDGASAGLLLQRVTPFDAEVERLRRDVTRDMTRAVVSLVLATGFAAVVRRWRQ